LTPSFLRRTVYGKVSRYKLDTYLSTFDFPTPNISAEKRFTTTVPLQRLFLMNSDFMQVESEELAKRVAAEPDNQARIKKVYQLAFGRQPTDAEIKLGIDYLHAEPMKEYEENKNKPPEPGAGGGRRGRGGQGGSNKGGAGAAVTKVDAPAEGSGEGKADGTIVTAAVAKVETSAGDVPEGAVAAKVAAKVEVPVSDTPEGSGDNNSGSAVVAKAEAPAGDSAEPAATEGGAPEVAADNAGMGDGMMGGVGGAGGRRGNGPAAAPPVKYDPTPWGRYIKVLLSSSEFLFVN